MRETKLEQHVKKAAHSHKGEKQNSSTGTSISEGLLLRVKRVVLTRGKGRSKGSILTVSKAHSLVCFFLVQSKLAETIHPSSSMISLLIPNIIQLSSSIPSLPATPFRLFWKQPLLLQREEGHAERSRAGWNHTLLFARGLGTENRPPYSSSGRNCSAAVFSAQCCWTLRCEFVRSGVASGQPE